MHSQTGVFSCEGWTKHSEGMACLEGKYTFDILTAAVTIVSVNRDNTVHS